MMDLELSDLLLCEFSREGDGPHFYNCWNLCREIFRRAGLVLPKYSEYITDISSRDILIRKLSKEDFVRLSKSEPLCIVALKFRPNCITHMGVVLDKRKFIHIRKTVGVVVERLNNPRWIKRFEGFYKYVRDNKN